MVNNMQDLLIILAAVWTRSMQALDGFTQSMVAFAETRGRVYDDITKGGLLEFDAEKAGELSQKVYSKMFDKTGLITDEAVSKSAGEIALNLDNGYRYVSQLISVLLFSVRSCCLPKHLERLAFQLLTTQ